MEIVRKIKYLAMHMIIISTIITTESNANSYVDKVYGFKFDTGQLTLSTSASLPNKLIFQTGKLPFSVSVQYRFSHGSITLDEYIDYEREQAALYPNEKEAIYTPINGVGFDAYEIIKEHDIGKIHWLVFQKKGSKRVFSFWLMENKDLPDANEIALSGFNSMKTSLTVVDGSLPQDLKLNKAVEVEAALKLNSILTGVSKAISTCFGAGKKQAICMCESASKINRLRNVVQSTFLKYPSWLKAKTLTFTLPNDKNVVLNPSILNAFVSKEIQCNN